MFGTADRIGVRSVRITLRAIITASFLALSLTSVLVSARAEPMETDHGSSDVFSLLKEESVSTALRREQPISQAPSNVYVITAEDIRHSGAVDVPTLLRRIPGIEVMQVTGADFNVSVRGNNQLFANKLLVLVDGRSVYIDVQGFVFWKGLPITLPEIKQIEVIKGPIAALYGFNAYDGVINIITKTPDEMKGTTLQVGGGEIGTVSTSAIHAGVTGKFKYRVSGGYDQTHQWRDRDTLAHRSSKFNAQVEYLLPDQSNVTLSSGLVHMNPHDGPVVGVGNTILTPEVALPYVNVSYDRPDLFLRAYWNGFFADAAAIPHPLLQPFITITDRGGNSNLGFASNTYNVEAQHSVSIGTIGRLTYGLNYRYNTLSCDCTASFEREHRLGAYVQAEWSVLPSVTVIGGLRYDLHSEINPTYSPRLAVLYTPVPGHTLRAQASVGYRPPTLFETYQDVRLNPLVPNPFLPASSRILGSRNLHPEEILSYEVGYQGWFYRHRLRLRADAFFNRSSDLIGRSSTSAVTNTVNTGSTEIYGAEAGLEFQASSWLTGFVNYSYQHIKKNTEGLARRGAPHSKVNVGLRAEWLNGLSGEAVLHYVGSATYPVSDSFDIFNVSPGTRVGGYTLLNLRAGYRFWEQDTEAGSRRSAELAVSAFNVLDDHREHPLGDLIGRRVMGWLTLKF
ncbi:putative TonB-dependent receptor [Candidatus Nitrospira inopinata]|uniref:Putative TonB-dependent receptor n=1 Tax=Candidatus Nitrospira inopinata TaxID=1715989 RepID=A0A0S4KUC9_9BACT|nr:putative TonB-dependent receptor [Candidatus Nitrospira inopinata]